MSKRILPPKGTFDWHEAAKARLRGIRDQQDHSRTRVVNRYIGMALIAYFGMFVGRLAYALVFESQTEASVTLEVTR